MDPNCLHVVSQFQYLVPSAVSVIWAAHHQTDFLRRNGEFKVSNTSSKGLTPVSVSFRLTTGKEAIEVNLRLPPALLIIFNPSLESRIANESRSFFDV